MGHTQHIIVEFMKTIFSIKITHMMDMARGGAVIIIWFRRFSRKILTDSKWWENRLITLRLASKNPTTFYGQFNSGYGNQKVLSTQNAKNRKLQKRAVRNKPLIRNLTIVCEQLIIIAYSENHLKFKQQQLMSS
jgi:hypothetical protein